VRRLEAEAIWDNLHGAAGLLDLQVGGPSFEPGERSGTGKNTQPAADLEKAIMDTFGSMDALKEKINTAAATRFGSGWAWLSVDKNNKLVVSSTPNQDNPLMAGVAECAGTPLLGCDVWEHAYYLNYQNRRADYLKAWWNTINWSAVEKNFANA
jgi:Fe-Mn family superoxide dismutase